MKALNERQKIGKGQKDTKGKAKAIGNKTVKHLDAKEIISKVPIDFTSKTNIFKL